jgi:hypothetical protein
VVLQQLQLPVPKTIKATGIPRNSEPLVKQLEMPKRPKSPNYQPNAVSNFTRQLRLMAASLTCFFHIELGTSKASRSEATSLSPSVS